MKEILLVDDEESMERLVTQRFRKEIREGEFHFYFAPDGFAALKTLEENPSIDCVITDISMPGMDGLTLLTRIQETAPLVKTVIISAYGDMANIRCAMNRGAFDFLTKPLDFADLRLTIQKTLEAVEALKTSRKNQQENEVLKGYVNPALVHSLRGSLEGGAGHGVARRVDATVGFVDICGFTRLSETLDPEALRTLLNQYFDIFAQETLRFGGGIDKFIGDAAMVVFEGDDHENRAARSILSIMERIKPFLDRTLAGEEKYPNVSAGLNSGEMISGEFGSRTIKRFDYTVIGDTVNIAARVESLSSPGQVLMPLSSTAGLSGDFIKENRGEFKLYNKKHPMEIVEIRPDPSADFTPKGTEFQGGGGR